MKTENSYSNHIGSIDKAFEIIEYLCDVGGEAGINEISKALSLSQSTVHRIVNAVKNTGFVYQNSDTFQYGLSEKFFSIGMMMQEHPSFLQYLAPYASGLRNKYGESVTVAVRFLQASTAPAYINVFGFSHNNGLGTRFQIGQPMPAHCSAAGKCLLAYSGEKYLQAYRGCQLKQKTIHTILDWDELEMEMAKIREQGYALDNEEYEIGLSAIAVPVFSTMSDRTTGTISVAGPTVRFDEEKRNLILQDLLKISRVSQS